VGRARGKAGSQPGAGREQPGAKAGVGSRWQGGKSRLRAEAAGESGAVETAVPVLGGAGGCARKGPEKEGDGERSWGEKDAGCKRDVPCPRC